MQEMEDDSAVSRGQRKPVGRGFLFWDLVYCVVWLSLTWYNSIFILLFFLSHKDGACMGLRTQLGD